MFQRIIFFISFLLATVTFQAQNNTMDFEVLTEIICDSELVFVDLYCYLINIDTTKTYEYRLCSDSTWTEVEILDDTYGFVMVDGALAGLTDSYCIEFRSSVAPNDIQIYQQNNIYCGLVTTQYIANVNVFLEGAYDENTGLMKTLLEEQDVLPLTQPYNISPYNYEGEEYLDTMLSSQFTSKIVDWVLVELRRGTPNLTEQNTEVIIRKAGLLLDTGEIVDAYNGSTFYFDTLLYDGEDYYICIRHRNHLDILSAEPIVVDDYMFSYDFTTSPSKAFGNFQQKTLSNGKAALFAGDYLQDGIIQLSDFDAWKANPAQLNVYSILDGTLDGVVQQTDNDLWLPNKAKIGVAEIRF